MLRSLRSTSTFTLCFPKYKISQFNCRYKHNYWLASETLKLAKSHDLKKFSWISTNPLQNFYSFWFEEFFAHRERWIPWAANNCLTFSISFASFFPTNNLQPLLKRNCSRLVSGLEILRIIFFQHCGANEKLWNINNVLWKFHGSSRLSYLIRLDQMHVVWNF